MAKKTKKAGYLGDQKLSMTIIVAIAVLVGVIMGVAIDSWQESAYEIGESEAIVSGTIK